MRHIDYVTDYDPNTITALLIYCENQLGWLPERGPHEEWWEVRQRELAKLKRTMKKTRVELDELWRVAKWCRRKKEPIETPSYLAYLVDRLDEAEDDEPTLAPDLDDQVAAAIELESRRRDPGWESWVGRLTRARGIEARREVLEEHQEARHG